MMTKTIKSILQKKHTDVGKPLHELGQVGA